MTRLVLKGSEIKQDGSRGWLVVFAAFMTHLITHGIVYSYGILFLAFEEVFGPNKAEIAWIASITTGTLYLSGPLASIFLRRHGGRVVAVTGSILSSIGCFVTLFSPNLYFMYVTLGFLTGLGYGLIFIPAVVEVTLYFKKYRAFACGIAVAGAGGGAFVFSPLIEFLLEKYAWRGTLLVCSALLLNCIPCALIFRNKFTVTETVKSSCDENINLNDHQKSDKNFVDKNNSPMKSKFSELYNEQTVTIDRNRQRIEIIIGKSDSLKTLQETEDEFHAESGVTDKMLKNVDNEEIQDTILRKHQSSKFTFLKILKQKKMVLFYTAQILFLFGFYFPVIGIPGMAVKYGIGESRAVWIISTIGISTVIGRVVLGYMADRSFINSILLYKFALLISGVSTAFVPLLSNFAALIIYALVYGMSTAVMLSQTTVVLVDIVGIEKMADAMGLNNMFCGIGALIGPPLLGVLYDETGSYIPPFVVSGMGMAVGGVLLFLMSCCTTV